MTEKTMSSQVSPSQSPFTPVCFPDGAGEGEVVILPRGLMTERIAKEDLKWYLLNKYQDQFTGRLTREDLEELQYCLRKMYDPKRGWNREYLLRFVLKMGEYIQEEILKREIAGIESLLTLMKPEDLRKKEDDIPARYDTRTGPVAGTPLKTLIWR